MKKFVLAAIAALTLGMGVASAATVGDGTNAFRADGTHWTVSTPGNFDYVGG